MLIKCLTLCSELPFMHSAVKLYCSSGKGFGNGQLLESFFYIYYSAEKDVFQSMGHSSLYDTYSFV